jgi:hypothetical protein
MKTFHRARLKSLLAAGGAAVRLTILLAVAAYAASDLNTVIDSVRNWVAGLLAALATLLLAIGGARYLTANGNPRVVLDCFAGSGTTLVAARGLGFHAIGIEGDLLAPGVGRDEEHVVIRTAIAQQRRAARALPCCTFWTANAAALGGQGPLAGLWRGVTATEDDLQPPRLRDMPARLRSDHVIDDCLGKPRWKERRPAGGAGW